MVVLQKQQALFEQVEIKPQAIEWLFATALGKFLYHSLDNLTGEGVMGQINLKIMFLLKYNVIFQVKPISTRCCTFYSLYLKSL